MTLPTGGDDAGTPVDAPADVVEEAIDRLNTRAVVAAMVGAAERPDVAELAWSHEDLVEGFEADRPRFTRL